MKFFAAHLITHIVSLTRGASDLQEKLGICTDRQPFPIKVVSGDVSAHICCMLNRSAEDHSAHRPGHSTQDDNQSRYFRSRLIIVKPQYNVCRITIENVQSGHTDPV